MHIFFTLLYLGTVALSVAVAYDPILAWKPGGLLAAGALLALAMAVAGRRRRPGFFNATGVSCALLAAAVGGYFLLRYDWDTAGEGKFAMIRQAGLWVQSHRPALPLAEDINGNVAGGALALLLPPGAVAAARGWRSRTPRGMAMALLLTPAVAGAAAALILTSSRGAWAGISVGGLVAGAMAVTARRAAGRYRVVTLSVAALILLAALGLTVAVVAWPAADRLLGGVAGAGNSVLSRAQLWRDGLALIGDYPFTGSGAGSTMMVYSTYAMLLHVGYISHAHNLFLQLALEQGVPGLAAFLALLALAWAALAERSTSQEDGWRAAAAASLTALVVHGTVDAGLYTAYLAPVLFVPIGLGLGFWGRGATEVATPRVAIPVVLTALLAGALLSPVRAAWQANLAALAQTRVELSAYRWPYYPIQDALRRQAPQAPPPVDLAPIVARYRAALALEPRNVTANRRLGQIKLSQGDYDAARAHLEVAYAAAPWQRPTRQLLAEAYAVTGEPERAAPLWASVDLGNGQLALRTWWYNAIGETERARW